ncbi:MAG: single-stranded-DNA-specific exonuclease RecJ [Planctomycetota bacterium]|jgi:single-stranded-DNA-specific exonuclease
MKKRWTYPPSNEALQASLVASLRISPILARLLVNRGIDDPVSAHAFLQPKMTHLSNPLECPEIEKAARRLALAVRNGERIAVYGDYDVDGITSTALLIQFFNLLKANATWYIPQRIEEGYGLNREAIERLASDAVDVIVTVDCGIKSIAEAQIIRDKGIDLIITDHHVPGSELPEALAIVNPRLPGSVQAFKEFSGAGLAFKLCWALAEVMSKQKKVAPEFREFLLDAMGLAALGTIADSVPLVGENRVLAKHGLMALSNSTHPGILALKDISNLAGSDVSSRHVGFRMGPRLNAAGRLWTATFSFELLTTRHADKAKRLAGQLEQYNRERQKIQSEMLDSSKEKIKNEIDLDSTRVIVLGCETWHPGVVGIVASRLVDEYHRPAVMIAIREGVGHGSARSVPGFHLPAALEASSDKLISFGGHSQAAGLKIRMEEVEGFRSLMNTYASIGMKEVHLQTALHTDGHLDMKDISLSRVRELELLVPYGEGNPEPVFIAEGLQVVGKPSRVGGLSGRHLSLHLRQGDVALRGIGFLMGELLTQVEQHSGQVSIAFTPTVSKWRGESVELEIKDLRFD